MTEKQKIERAYARVQKKYPDVVEQERLTDLAIKGEKAALLWKAAGTALGALGCWYVAALLGEQFGETRWLLLAGGACALVEGVRLLRSRGRTEQRFRPVVTANKKKTIDGEFLRKKYKGKLYNCTQFYMVTLPLRDKEDESDYSSISGLTSHEFWLCFEHPKTRRNVRVKTERKEFDKGILGRDYFVIMTRDKNGGEDLALAAYSADWYMLATDLEPLCRKAGEDSEQGSVTADE